MDPFNHEVTARVRAWLMSSPANGVPASARTRLGVRCVPGVTAKASNHNNTSDDDDDDYDGFLVAGQRFAVWQPHGMPYDDELGDGQRYSHPHYRGWRGCKMDSLLVPFVSARANVEGEERERERAFDLPVCDRTETRCIPNAANVFQYFTRRHLIMSST